MIIVDALLGDHSRKKSGHPKVVAKRTYSCSYILIYTYIYIYFINAYVHTEIESIKKGHLAEISFLI